MKFFTNRIPVGKPSKSFADIIKEATSSNKTIKTAAQKEAADCENLPDFLKKKLGCEDGGEETEKEDTKEAIAGEQEIKVAEGENYEEERRTDVHHMEGSKMQQSSGKNGEPEDKGASTAKEGGKSKDAPKSEEKKEAKSANDKKQTVAKAPVAKVPAKKAEKVAPTNKDNPTRTDVHHQENTKDQESKGTNGEPEDEKAKKEAANKAANLKKYANLTSKQKTFLRTIYRMFWPESFVEAVIADK